MNQVFLKEAPVALDRSKRISSPPSAYAKKSEKRIAGPDPYTHDVDVFSLHNHVNHLPRDRIPLLIEANTAAKVHFDLGIGHTIPSQSSRQCRVMLSRLDHACLLLALRRHQSISPRCSFRILSDPFDPFQISGVIQSLNQILQPRREKNKECHDRLCFG
jgi:hypothetical protein